MCGVRLCVLQPGWSSVTAGEKGNELLQYAWGRTDG